MKGNMRKMSKVNETKREGAAVPASALEEMMGLYNAWLGYLLTLHGEGDLRVKAEDIRDALGRFSCAVTREGEEYVIRLQAVPHVGQQAEGEAVHGG
jgi:hypothetical protein